jgi:hypothetical protein
MQLLYNNAHHIKKRNIYYMQDKEAETHILLTAALIATALRILSHIFGGDHGVYLRTAISQLGFTVVILEVCIILLRFFTTFQIMRKVSKHVSTKYHMLLFTCIGILISYFNTVVPELIFGQRKDIVNDAIVYINERPFELLPIVVEYMILYVLHSKILHRDISLSFLCTALIGLVIAIRDVMNDKTGLQTWPSDVADFSIVEGFSEVASSIVEGL